MSDAIDIAYRPQSYFGPQRLEEFLISQVKGAVVRKKLQELLAEGRHDELQALLGEHGISRSSLSAMESVHPMFMGGNYLPGAKEGEVEVARIEISSTTFDVTCLYARQKGGKIHFRVVDEYEGDTLSGPSKLTSAKPLSLGEMTDFFLEAWPLLDVLEANFDGDRESALDFFVARSKFYPDFDRLCRKRVVEAFPEPGVDEDDNA